jgi:hypothetical protein
MHVYKCIHSAGQHKFNATNYKISNIILIIISNTMPSQLAAGWTVRDQIPVQVRFSAPVQIGPGAQPAAYTMGTGVFPESNAAGAWR